MGNSYFLTLTSIQIEFVSTLPCQALYGSVYSSDLYPSRGLLGPDEKKPSDL
jgi:hypothetical protein